MNIKNNKFYRLFDNELLALIWNIALAILVYMACRFLYWAENYQSFSLTASQWAQILQGGLKFDLSAILYTNILLLLLLSFPFHLKEKIHPLIGKILFVLINSIAVVVNLSDAVYFKFTGRRTTVTVFQEFASEDNLTSIFAKEFVNHWYLVLAGIILILAIWKLYKTPAYKRPKNLISFYSIKTAVFLLLIYLTINGMRGGFGTAVRPITISNANQYASKPAEAALVLNTPFSIFRTIGQEAFVTPSYYTDSELEDIYTPIHQPADTAQFKAKNVVVFIIESFGKEYIGALNKNIDSAYQGFTPFTDSLIGKSLTFRYSYSNGRKSIDGMPSILSSIPMFIEPFFLTPASMNRLSGIAGELSKKGYYTAFFHGAKNGSMGFQAFANATGFRDYFGRTEYNQDNRFGGDNDFDGTWAIWDEPFMQFYATKMSEMPQPFMTAIFTASSHHPFVIPEQYKDSFPEGSLVIHKCIRYTDNALRRFFEYASKQEWYPNTIFAITADHTNLTEQPVYQTDLGGFSVPIIFFDPSGSLPTGISDKIAQQIDIMPTILNALNYSNPYIAFGCDLLTEPDSSLFAVNYCNGIYQYVKNGMVLQFDGKKSTGLYRLTDMLMQNNILGQSEYQTDMECKLKAVIQQYMTRMNGDMLTIDN